MTKTKSTAICCDLSVGRLIQGVWIMYIQFCLKDDGLNLGFLEQSPKLY